MFFNGGGGKAMLLLGRVNSISADLLELRPRLQLWT